MFKYCSNSWKLWWRC